jgi:hypothetical protein
MRTVIVLVYFIGLIVLSCACVPATPTYGIMYSVATPDPSTSELDLEQIDTAWREASVLAGVDPDKVLQQGLVLSFEDRYITYNGAPGERFYGLTVPGACRVYWTETCLFNPKSALLHEFLHAALALKTQGDVDAGHLNPAWRIVDARRQALELSECYKGVMPPFMGNPNER